MERALFVSPHPDDAVFSCPGRIMEAAKAGAAPLVYTVFTRDSAGELAARLKEDREAARLCGFEAVAGGFVDAPFRDPPHRDFQAIVFGSGPGDGALSGEIAAELVSLADREGALLLFGPLGAGRHVDHRITHEACAKACAARPALQPLFYEDRPYSFVDQAVEARLAELGFDSKPAPERFFSAFFEARYVRAFLPPGERARCRALFESLFAAPRRALPLPPSEILAFAGIDALWPPIASYRSQLGGFAGAKDEFFACCKTAAGRMGVQGPYAERFWKFEPGIGSSAGIR